MTIGWMRVCLRLQGVRTLKEKRHIVRPLLQGIGEAPNIAAAEIGDHDLWGNAEIGISVVGTDSLKVEQCLQQIETLFDAGVSWEVFSVERGIERLS